MNLGDPTIAVTPTLDGPVLAVLAAAGRPLTVGEVAAASVRGSEIGIRRCLSRLVGQGIVMATQMGRNRVHELNRDHVAASAALALGELRLELWRRLRQELQGWTPEPFYACVFGSAARGDGDDDSDIDILLVHPPFPDDPPSKSARAALVSLTLRPADPAGWSKHIDQLRGLVLSWAGNPIQVLDVSVAEWSSRTPHEGVWAEIERDAIEIVPRAFVTGRG